MASPALLTPAHYKNWMPFEVQECEGGLAIVAGQLPRQAITLHAGIIAAAFCGFAGLCHFKAPEGFWVTVGTGALTVGGFLVVVPAYYRSQQQRGPVLVYNRKNGTVELPREARTFRADEIDCLCLVQGEVAEEHVCQLQLHLRTGDPVLLVSGCHGALDSLFDALASGVPVPARRETEGRRR